MVYKITLSDGTVLDNLGMNGNNFVSATEVTESDFSGKLSKVTVNDGTADTVYEDLQLVQVAKYNDGWYFILGGKGAAQKREDEITEIQEALAEIYASLQGGAS